MFSLLLARLRAISPSAVSERPSASRRALICSSCRCTTLDRISSGSSRLLQNQAKPFLTVRPTRAGPNASTMSAKGATTQTKRRSRTSSKNAPIVGASGAAGWTTECGGWRVEERPGHGMKPHPCHPFTLYFVGAEAGFKKQIGRHHSGLVKARTFFSYLPGPARTRKSSYEADLLSPGEFAPVVAIERVLGPARAVVDVHIIVKERCVLSKNSRAGCLPLGGT